MTAKIFNDGTWFEGVCAGDTCSGNAGYEFACDDSARASAVCGWDHIYGCFNAGFDTPVWETIMFFAMRGSVANATKCESVDDVIERIAERTFQRVTGQSSKGMTKGDWEAMQARLHARDARLMGDERAARAWEQIAAEREGQ
jgi:hypothetical protein